MTWFPVIENTSNPEKFLVGDPVELFRTGNFEKVPLIIGRTRDEFVDIPYSEFNNAHFNASNKEHFSRQGMINTDIAHRLNENFDEIAPFCFFYESGTEKSSHMSQTLKKAYFRDEPITNRSLTSLSQIFSDGYVGWSVHRLAQLISNVTNVFYYELSFIGQHSFFHYPHEFPYGVHHSDEMQYIMETVFVGPQITTRHRDNRLVERMTKIVAQFAEFG